MQLRTPFEHNSRLGLRANPDPVYWRLLYTDGRMLEEKDSGSSIRDAWPSPSKLHIMDWAGRAICEIDIPLGSKPVWYRRRGMTANDSFPVLLATVFGFARENGSRIDGTLYAYMNGQVVDCPEQHIDLSALALNFAD